jgi:hypothetical protein
MLRNPRGSFFQFVLLAGAALVSTFACSTDPVTRIEQLRSRYSASLGGFVVRDLPESGHQEVIVDVLLRWDGTEPLSGVTLDLSLVDARGELKAARKLWVETQGWLKGETRQQAFTFSDLNYVEGDGFYVELRTPVPASERSQYREFGQLRQ